MNCNILISFSHSFIWDITLYSPLNIEGYFGRICRLHLRGRRISQARNQYEASNKQSNPLAQISGLYSSKSEMPSCLEILSCFPKNPNFRQMVHTACYFLHDGFLLGLFFDTEDGSDMFLRNVGLVTTDYMALYPRRQNYTCNYCCENQCMCHEFGNKFL
jgi:hypothetical protein